MVSEHMTPIKGLKIDTDGTVSEVTLTLTGADGLVSVRRELGDRCLSAERVICHPDANRAYDFQAWMDEDALSTGAVINPAASVIVSASNPDRPCPQVYGPVILTGAVGRPGDIGPLHELTPAYVEGVLSMLNLTADN